MTTVDELKLELERFDGYYAGYLHDGVYPGDEHSVNQFKTVLRKYIQKGGDLNAVRIPVCQTVYEDWCSDAGAPQFEELDCYLTPPPDTTLLAAVSTMGSPVDLEIIRYLIENGADVQGRNNQALVYAVEYGRLEVVRYLVQHGADIHVLDNQMDVPASRWYKPSVDNYLEHIKEVIDLLARAGITCEKEQKLYQRVLADRGVQSVLITLPGALTKEQVERLLENNSGGSALL